MVTPGLRQELPIAIEKAASVRRTFGLRNIRQASSWRETTSRKVI